MIVLTGIILSSPNGPTPVIVSGPKSLETGRTAVCILVPVEGQFPANSWLRTNRKSVPSWSTSGCQTQVGIPGCHSKQ